MGGHPPAGRSQSESPLFMISPARSGTAGNPGETFSTRVTSSPAVNSLT